MTEKKSKQLWPQTPLQWLGVLVLLFLAYSAWEAVGNIVEDPYPELTAANEAARRATEKHERLVKELEEKYPKTIAVNAGEVGELILGKWRYWGSLGGGEDQRVDFTEEYFSNGAFFQTVETPLPENTPSTTAGIYKLAGAQIYIDHNVCEGEQCQMQSYTKSVSFPDANTMHVDKDGVIYVYNREY
jgi:hypothetical protein